MRVNRVSASRRSGKTSKKPRLAPLRRKSIHCARERPVRRAS